jgi:hypothetical protein
MRRLWGSDRFSDDRSQLFDSGRDLVCRDVAVAEHDATPRVVQGAVTEGGDGEVSVGGVCEDGACSPYASTWPAATSRRGRSGATLAGSLIDVLAVDRARLARLAGLDLGFDHIIRWSEPVILAAYGEGRNATSAFGVSSGLRVPFGGDVKSAWPIGAGRFCG